MFNYFVCFIVSYMINGYILETSKVKDRYIYFKRINTEQDMEELKEKILKEEKEKHNNRFNKIQLLSLYKLRS